MLKQSTEVSLFCNENLKKLIMKCFQGSSTISFKNTVKEVLEKIFWRNFFIEAAEKKEMRFFFNLTSMAERTGSKIFWGLSDVVSASFYT